MDDPPNPDDPNSSAEPIERRPSRDPEPGVAPITSQHGFVVSGQTELLVAEGVASRRQNLRRNLLLLVSLALVAFVLTSWIMVRVDVPFGILFTGPQEVVRAQLRAIGRDELRPAYDMFSARYRKQVSFDAWHELCLSHWRMFHGSVVRSEIPQAGGPGVTLEIFLRGADNKDYRARFTLIRASGRWWIDDVHWNEEPDARGVWRS